MRATHQGASKRPGMLNVAALALALQLCLQPILAANPPARDPNTGLIRIMYVGDCFSYGRTPFNYYKEEPAFSISGVPNDYLASPQRAMRQYVPRTYQDGVDRYDTILLSDAQVALFGVELQSWFRQGVIEAGQGLLMIGGYHSFGGYPGRNPWSGSSVEEVLPVTCLDGMTLSTYLFLVPVDEGNPFCTSLPWKEAKPFLGMNMVQMRESAKEVMSAKGYSWPLLVYWEVGRGSGIAHTPDLTPGWGEQFTMWEYYPDYVCNLIYLLARLGIPQDPDLMHVIRTVLHNYHQQRAVLISLTEFVERFGANSVPIQEGLVRIQEMKEEADSLYLAQDYAGVLPKMDEVSLAVERLEQEALRLKDRALIWIFVVEWFAVTGTLMVSGYALWSLMVRRRLYREVRVTRLQAS